MRRTQWRGIEKRRRGAPLWGLAVCGAALLSCGQREPSPEETQAPAHSDAVPPVSPEPEQGAATSGQGESAVEETSGGALAESGRVDSGEAQPQRTKTGVPRRQGRSLLGGEREVIDRGTEERADFERVEVEGTRGVTGAESGKVEERGVTGVEGVESAVGAERGSVGSNEGAPDTLDGQILYGGPPLPRDAQIRVMLIGTEEGGALAEEVIKVEGEPPYEFSLPLRPGGLSGARAVRVTIEDSGQVLYSTLQEYTPNFAEGSVLPVQVRMNLGNVE